jgi:inhibitor of cysteine peptidase
MKIWYALLLFSLSMSAAASDDLSMTVNTHTSKKQFVVSLAANPTTGYQWTLVQFDKNILTLSSSYYQKTQTYRIGSGGQMLFTFALRRGKNYPAKTDIVFKYARPWEQKEGGLKKVKIRFVSVNGPNDQVMD